MPMWRCPHCGTPQAETARCWVCHRSSTACATCRNFRGSVAAQLGYCGLDRARRPLRGNEIRACWEAPALQPEAPATVGTRYAQAPTDLTQERTPVRRLEFVEVRTTPVVPRRRTAAVGGSGSRGAARTAARAAEVVDSDPDEPPPAAVSTSEPSWSLWGDADI